MKLLILSDLHLEFGVPYSPPPGLDFDVVILAGDIDAPGGKAVDWAKSDATFSGLPVVLVAGNHEFYKRVLDDELAQMKCAVSGSSVHVLDRDAVVIGGVRFIGATLWTDFQLPVQTPTGPQSNVELSIRHAAERLNDFELIEVATEAAARSYHSARYRHLRRPFTPADALARHWLDRDWLRRQLLEPFNGPTVVVTHHAPSAGSVAPRYASDWLTPAFASALPSDFFEVPQLWVHGHTHSAFDYMEGSCRVVSNPRGYRLNESRFENQMFDAGFVVEMKP